MQDSDDYQFKESGPEFTGSPGKSEFYSKIVEQIYLFNNCFSDKKMKDFDKTIQLSGKSQNFGRRFYKKFVKDYYFKGELVGTKRERFEVKKNYFKILFSDGCIVAHVDFLSNLCKFFERSIEFNNGSCEIDMTTSDWSRNEFIAILSYYYGIKTTLSIRHVCGMFTLAKYLLLEDNLLEMLMKYMIYFNRELVTTKSYHMFRPQLNFKEFDLGKNLYVFSKNDFYDCVQLIKLFNEFAQNNNILDVGNDAGVMIQKSFGLNYEFVIFSNFDHDSRFRKNKLPRVTRIGSKHFSQKVSDNKVHRNFVDILVHMKDIYVFERLDSVTVVNCLQVSEKYITNKFEKQLTELIPLNAVIVPCGSGYFLVSKSPVWWNDYCRSMDTRILIHHFVEKEKNYKKEMAFDQLFQIDENIHEMTRKYEIASFPTPVDLKSYFITYAHGCLYFYNYKSNQDRIAHFRYDLNNETIKYLESTTHPIYVKDSIVFRDKIFYLPSYPLDDEIDFVTSLEKEPITFFDSFYFDLKSEKFITFAHPYVSSLDIYSKYQIIDDELYLYTMKYYDEVGDSIEICFKYVEESDTNPWIRTKYFLYPSDTAVLKGSKIRLISRLKL